jgi:RNA polymerase sigma factor (sigma-70 family)
MNQLNAAPDRILEQYYSEVRDIQLLTPDEERSLFQAYRSCTKCTHEFPVKDSSNKCPDCGTRRNFAARDVLIRGAMRFALREAKRYAVKAKGHRHDNEVLQSLISAGNLGLLIAVDRFDPAFGTRFLTYAANWVKEKIREELDHMGLVRVPVYKQKDLRRKRKAGESTEDEVGHVRVEDLDEVDKRQTDETLEAALIDGYGSKLIYKALEELEFRGRDKYIVLAYFGVKDEPKSMKQIAELLGLSMERIRQIKKKAMLRLKTYLDEQSIAGTTDIFSD